MVYWGQGSYSPENRCQNRQNTCLKITVNSQRSPSTRRLTMNYRYTCIIIIMLLLIGCQGKQGPTGPGSRIVYEGTATTDEYTVNIPELHIDDFPSVDCYYLLDGAWSELYLEYDDDSETVYPFALIEEQKVILFWLAGLEYKIVLVI